MSKLEALLAEKWLQDNDTLNVYDPGSTEEKAKISFCSDDYRTDWDRLLVVVLGKWALSALLNYHGPCPSCSDGRVSIWMDDEHLPGCEWGAIVKAAKELR